MEPIVVWYLRMSILYFVAGATVGVSMLLWPGESEYYMAVHAHLNLLGFMSMMIYGVGYHILPKFSGRLIYSSKIMNLQFWLANAGLIGMALSWPMTMRGLNVNVSGNILILSASLVLVSVLLFAVNILKTVKPVQMN
jgi:heme/copper-type cytochrome/quinol oxidase subunit 1